MPITVVPPLTSGPLAPAVVRGSESELLAHCNEPGPRDLAPLRKEWNSALRQVSSAIRKHGDPGYRADWETEAHPEVLAARHAADEVQGRLRTAEAIEQRKLMWALTVGKDSKYRYKTFRQCLEQDLVLQLPTEHSPATWKISYAYMDGPVAAREAFYDLPLGILFMLEGFGGTQAPPPGAMVRVTQEALEEARQGWDPLAVEAFKATNESRKLRREHSSLLKTRFFKRLVDAYAYDRDSFEELVATKAYCEAGRGANASQSQAFAKKATVSMEVILVRAAVRYLGAEDAAHLFHRIAHATMSDRPSVMEFFRLLEDYNGDSYFPGVPEFDLKPAK